ncbi:hypothetical protein Tco_0679950 [Tanacetum coccineum]|uniref:Uncharacterized protein n=1 Tax=Tanacetum coccineum TaxID=301880 RepID=A0ABQ4XKK3_9ASTR
MLATLNHLQPIYWPLQLLSSNTNPPNDEKLLLLEPSDHASATFTTSSRCTRVTLLLASRPAISATLYNRQLPPIINKLSEPPPRGKLSLDSRHWRVRNWGLHDTSSSDISKSTSQSTGRGDEDGKISKLA